MLIKSTFSNRVFDWVIICITLFFSILGVVNLFSDFDSLQSGLLPRIVFFLLSLFAFLFMVLPQVNGERMTQLFIGGVLIIPAMVPVFIFLTELIFNQELILQYLYVPYLFYKLILGLVLLYLSIKFTNKKRSKKRKNLGIFMTGLGFYVLVFLIFKGAESAIKPSSEDFELWQIIVKLVLGISLVITGLQVRYRKMSFKLGLILTVLVFILFFLL